MSYTQEFLVPSQTIVPSFVGQLTNWNGTSRLSKSKCGGSKGPRYIPANYRPVSLRSIACKLLEGMIRDYIQDFSV